MKSSLFRHPFPRPVRRPHEVWEIVLLCTCMYLLSCFFLLQQSYIHDRTLVSRIGLLTAVLTLAVWGLSVFILPWILPSCFDEKRWTLARECMFSTLVLLTSGALLLLYLQLCTEPSTTAVMQPASIVYAIAIPAMTIWNTARFFHLNRKFTLQAASINALMHHKKRNSTFPDATVEFRSSGKQSALTLTIREILYIERKAADVYVVSIHEGILRQDKITDSLKHAREKLRRHTAFYRCHRDWIINLDQVREVAGNAQGLRLCIFGTGEKAPVASNLREEIVIRLSK